MASTEASSGSATRLAGDVASRRRRGPGAAAGTPGPALSDRLPRPWLFPLLVYAVTFAGVVATWQVANAIYGASEPWTYYFLFKDASHYLAIAEHGYPARLALPVRLKGHGYPPYKLVNLPAAYQPLFNPLVTYKATPPTPPYPYLPAFFPGLSLVVWALHWVTGGSFLLGALATSIVGGAAAALGVWAVAAKVCGHWVADRAVVAFCLFPGAVTFGMLYSEPLAVAISAAVLLAMLDRRWVLAGLIAGFGTAERPTLIVLTGLLGVGAIVAIWQRREWRSLAAAPLSLLGGAVFLAVLGTRYHDASFWLQTEENGWHSHIDWGVHTFELVTWQLGKVNDQNAFYSVLLLIMMVSALAGIALMIKARLPWQLTLFTVATIVSFVVSAGQGTKPRFVWSAFGLFIGLAAVRLPRWAFWPLVAAQAGLLAFLIGWWPHHYIGPAP
jgi:hypothetical protein